MSKKLISAEELHNRWMRDAEYSQAVADLEDELALARALIKARAEAGLTQAQVAERMGVSRPNVVRLERGNHMPSTRTLVQFAAATGHRASVEFVRVNEKYARAGTSESTSKKVASSASKVLRSKTATKAEKSVAASALTQKGSTEQTSKKVAAAASKILKSKSASKAAKSAAASALTQKTKKA